MYISRGYQEAWSAKGVRPLRNILALCSAAETSSFKSYILDLEKRCDLLEKLVAQVRPTEAHADSFLFTCSSEAGPRFEPRRRRGSSV